MTQKIEVKITELSPILMNNLASMEDGDTDGVKTKKKKYVDTDEAEKRVYRLDNGQLYIPAVAFRGSVINSGGGAMYRKLGQHSAASRFSAGVFLLDEKCPLVDAKSGKPIKKYQIDKRAVVIQQGSKKNRVMRCRPLIDNWACVLRLELDEELINAGQAIELLELSGKIAGVMDFRPQCKGWFGRYKAKLVK